jgi:hypothetical protein
VFGLLYGLGVFLLYDILDSLGTPTFYDKLLCVPLLNLSVQVIDRLLRPRGPGHWRERLGLQSVTMKSNLVHMGVWVAFFATMTFTGSTDGRHTGDSVPFWQEACAENRRKACDTLLLVESVYCDGRSGWACNERGVHYSEGLITAQDLELSQAEFSRACVLGFRAGCLNLLLPGSHTRSVPRTIDLRIMLREGKRNLLNMPEDELNARACTHGWIFACAKS